jgi:hypothetical protein
LDPSGLQFGWGNAIGEELRDLEQPPYNSIYDQYLAGAGGVWDLGGHGQLSQVRNDSDVQGVVSGAKQKLKSHLKKKAYATSCSNPQDSFRKQGSDFAEVQDSLYFVGGTTIAWSAHCKVQLSGCRCCPGMDKQFPSSWGGSCQITFRVEDEFADPLQVRETIGQIDIPAPSPYYDGDLFPIGEHGFDPLPTIDVKGNWKGRVTEGGKMPTPC